MAKRYRDVFGYTKDRQQCTIEGCCLKTQPIKSKGVCYGYYPYCFAHYNEAVREYNKTRPSPEERKKQIKRISDRKRAARLAYRSVIGPVKCGAYGCEVVSNYVLCEPHKAELRQAGKLAIKCILPDCTNSVEVTHFNGKSRKARCLFHRTPPSLIRAKCIVHGCENIQAVHKVVKGKLYYRRYCEKHRKKLSPDVKVLTRRLPFPPPDAPSKKHCFYCRWDLAACDKHRIIPGQQGGGYTAGNVRHPCPNCHRLLHSGWSHEQILEHYRPKRKILLGVRA